MYICICNGITDKQIKTAINEGACSLSCLKKELGLASQCGRCADSACQIIQESAAQIPQPGVQVKLESYPGATSPLS